LYGQFFMLFVCFSKIHFFLVFQYRSKTAVCLLLGGVVM